MIVGLFTLVIQEKYELIFLGELKLNFQIKAPVIEKFNYLKYNE